MKKFLLFSMLLLAGTALALQQLDLNVSPRITAFLSGVLLGPKASFPTDAKINASRITRSAASEATINFAAGTIVCEESAAITVTGAKTGDECVVGYPAALTNVDAGILNGTFSCRVTATDAVKVRHCPSGTENDPISGVFNVRTFSHQ